MHIIQLVASEGYLVLGVAKWRRGREVGRAAGRQGVLLEPPFSLPNQLHLHLTSLIPPSLLH